MGRLDSKVAAVTGGASGIGEATVRCFVGEGASVTFCDRDSERGQRVAAAHGEHEKRTGQPDPNWPDWYADYIVRERPARSRPTTSGCPSSVSSGTPCTLQSVGVSPAQWSHR
jgi:NAD(P)-dependent dehydrogenase (short-subunit alcohol dehydrogenase family)